MCICYSLYDACRLIERDVACTRETVLLLAYAVASLRPKGRTIRYLGGGGARVFVACKLFFLPPREAITLRQFFLCFVDEMKYLFFVVYFPYYVR